MSNYGQQPPYGQTPYGPQNPYGQPQQPYGRPGQAPYGQPQPYGGQPVAPYGAPPAPGAAQPVPYPPPPGYGAPPQPGQPYGQVPPPTAQWTAQVPPAKPEIAHRDLVVVTMESVPGRVIIEVLGDVVGVVARSRELPRDGHGGSQLEGYVNMMTQSRQDAVNAMVEMATGAGADAVIGLRYDSSEITQTLSEVVAYGTAVRLNPIADEAAADKADDERVTGTETAINPLSPPDFDTDVAAGPASSLQSATPQSPQQQPQNPSSTQSWPPPSRPGQG